MSPTGTKSSKVATRARAASAPAKHGPATEKAKRAARKVIEQNIARLDAAEQAATPGTPVVHGEQGGEPQQPQPDQQQTGEAEAPVPVVGPTPTPGTKRGRKAKNAASAQLAGSSPAKGKKGGKTVKVEKPPKVKRLSCLDAAAQIIGKEPIGCADLIAEMGKRKLWTSPGGKTPDASLYAAIIREIAAKKGEARFRKVDRGLFTANTKK